MNFIKRWWRDWLLRRQQDRMVMGDLSKGTQTPVSKTEGGRLFRKIATDRCPDCGHEGFWAGPTGGMSQNIFCRNPVCRSGFNVTDFIGTADRIGPGSDRYYNMTSQEGG